MKKPHYDVDHERDETSRYRADFYVHDEHRVRYYSYEGQWNDSIALVITRLSDGKVVFESRGMRNPNDWFKLQVSMAANKHRTEELLMKINEKAVLVKLSITMPGVSRKDRDLTNDVLRERRMEPKSARVLKELYPDHALDPINKHCTMARDWHESHSLPWLDKGVRILPSSHYVDYTDKMRGFRHAFEDHADMFVARRSEWVKWAMQAHNGAFREQDYPEADILRSKFSFHTDLRPVPSGNDFRVQFSKEEMEAIQERMDVQVGEAVEAAQKDLWRRLGEPVRNLAVRMRQEKYKVHDSIIGNIRDIVALIPVLNLTGDYHLERIREDIETTLAVIDPEHLRKDKSARPLVAEAAEAILNRMSGYFGNANTQSS